jgi:hypothetical protein
MTNETPYIGKYVVIRAYAAGVHVGKLYEKNGNEVILHDSRRIWYWEGAATLSQLAMEGVKKPDNCKFSVVLPEIQIINIVEIIPMSNIAKQNIYKVAEWKE